MKIKRAAGTFSPCINSFEPAYWTKDTIDLKLMIRIENGKASPVAWWLIASYLYYQKNISILKDETFDWLGKWLRDNWETIKHPHKRLINRKATFTGYYVKRYPRMVVDAAERLMEELNKCR